MTAEEVFNTFPNDGWFIVLGLYNAYITPQGFVDMYGGEGSSLTYDWLYNHKNATPMWKKQFTAWHEQGII